MAQPYHFFDPYLKGREQAARERAAWRKTLPKHGPKQDGPLWRGGLAGRAKRPVTLASVTLAKRG